MMPEIDAGLPAASVPSPRLQAIGAAMVALSTVAIAIVPTFTKLAFDGGSNTLTVVMARSILTVALTWFVMVVLGQSLRLGRTPLLISLATGVFYAVMLYGFLGAVAFIPVNTVILIYFTHPLLVGLVAARLGHEVISAKMVRALIAAFAGLGLAVGLSFASFNLAGIALAALSSVTCVFVVVGNGRAMKQAGSLAVIFYMMLSASIALALPLLAFGTIALPETLSGWIGFGGVAVGYTVGTLAFFCAVPILGAVRSAMISNIEPLLGIIFALVILGERVSPLQGVGIALVLASIVVMELKL
jgi:drug/metabolite transporter (DMT)-like permease